MGEDERVPAEPVTLTMVEPPPAYPGQEANLGQLYLKQVRGDRGGIINYIL